MSDVDKALRKYLKNNPPRMWMQRPEVLLCPNVPKPLHGVAPRVVLGNKWWDATRKEAYASTNFHCIACGVHKTQAKSRQWLEGHEWYDIDYQKGTMTYVETIPLCHFCHNFIHDGRLNALLQKGLIHHAKFVAIIQHGDAVLESAGLHRVPHYGREQEIQKAIEAGKVAEWSKWRLIVGKKKYPPLYKSYEQWLVAMNTRPVEGED